MADFLINHAYVMKPLIDGVGRTSGLVNISICQKGAHSNFKVTEAPALRTLLNLALCASSSGWSFVSL